MAQPYPADAPYEGPKPLVSILMANHNGAHFLSEAVASVTSQTYKNWELLIADDASSDGSRLLIALIASKDSRVRPVLLESREGAPTARNAALRQATGKYVAVLDSDDRWSPEKLALQVSHLEASSSGLAYASYMRVDEDGRPLGLVKAPRSATYESLLRGNVIGNLTGIYNAERYGKHFYENVGHEDYLVWLRLLQRSGERAENVSPHEPLAYYRVRRKALSANKIRAARWQWAIYRRHLNLPFFESLSLLLSYAGHALKKRL